jgi:hypothetical protein
MILNGGEKALKGRITHFTPFIKNSTLLRKQIYSLLIIRE